MGCEGLVSFPVEVWRCDGLLRSVECAGTGTESRISRTSFSKRSGIPRHPSRILRWGGCVLNIVHRLEKKTVDIPVLFIQATNDAALPPSLSDGMERFVPDLTRKEVEASHWALWQKPVEVNGMVREWLERAEKTKSSL